MHLLGDLADASTEATNAIRSYLEFLENDQAPKARSSFRLGRDKFEQKLRLEDGIPMTADRLLAIAERELEVADDQFRKTAAKLDGGDPAGAPTNKKEP